MSALVSFLTAGVRVDLVGADDEVLELVRRVAPASVVDRSAGPPTVTVDAREIAVCADADPGQAAATLLHEVHKAALEATPALTIHAAVLAGPAGCVMLPAASGAGKSTLAAAALQRGLVLLSDEAACLTSEVGWLVPHVRPIKLSRASRRLLGVAGDADPEGEIALAPEIFGRAATPASTHRCLGVLLPRRADGRAATLEPVSKSVALAAVLKHRLHQERGDWSSERAWEHLTQFVADIRAAIFHFDDPYEAADRLGEFLGEVSQKPSAG